MRMAAPRRADAARAVREAYECRDQATTPQSTALRSNVMNAPLSHAPRKVGGVVSVDSAARAPREAGLWQCPRAKYATPPAPTSRA